jgi:endonuclease-3
MDTTELAAMVHQLLLEAFGAPVWRPHLPPVDELVSTILSQNTNDRNRDLAFDNMKAIFPGWEDVRDAPIDKLEESIKIAGLSRQKASAIQNALRKITDERGKIELEFLRTKSNSEALNWLKELKGVGPKTAAIVLLFSLNKPAFPVDTHVHRVTGRLGLRPDKMNPEKAHTFLAEQFLPETYYPVHLNLIRLGREICKARRPICQDCPLKSICRYYGQKHNEILPK